MFNPRDDKVTEYFTLSNQPGILGLVVGPDFIRDTDKSFLIQRKMKFWEHSF